MSRIVIVVKSPEQQYADLTAQVVLQAIEQARARGEAMQRESERLRAMDADELAAHLLDVCDQASQARKEALA